MNQTIPVPMVPLSILLVGYSRGKDSLFGKKSEILLHAAFSSFN